MQAVQKRSKEEVATCGKVFHKPREVLFRHELDDEIQN